MIFFNNCAFRDTYMALVNVYDATLCKVTRPYDSLQQIDCVDWREANEVEGLMDFCQNKGFFLPRVCGGKGADTLVLNSAVVSMIHLVKGWEAFSIFSHIVVMSDLSKAKGNRLYLDVLSFYH